MRYDSGVTFFVLTYHSHNIDGTEYAGNDHVAFAQDLEVIRSAGAEVASLEEIASRMAAGDVGRVPCVGLSFDDGPVFDAADFVHPRFGPQRGFLNIMRDFRERHGKDVLPKLHATSFVIASPEARRHMQAEVSDYPGEWLADDWWRDAIASGFMDIGNHSWDHVHHAVPETVAGKPERDDFALVDTFDGAEKEIHVASQFIETRTGKVPAMFAFPFGHTNGYLVDEYLPEHGPCFGLKAAFGTNGVARVGDSVWSIPRIVCGYDWRSPQELERIIAG
jgi:Polysaccharide deacetylase